MSLPTGLSQQLLEQAIQVASGLTPQEKASSAATLIARHQLASQVPGLQQAQQKLLQAQNRLAQARAAGEAVWPGPRDIVFDVEPGEFDQEVLNAPGHLTMVVDFWAPWCGPCLMLGPVLDRVVKSYGGRAVLAKVNVDDDPETSRRYGIRGIPTVKVFRGGELVGEFSGARAEEDVAGILGPLVFGRQLQEYRQAESELGVAEQEWARVAVQYQAELTRIYNEVHPACLDAVTEKARDSAQEARDASVEGIKATFQHGKYTWITKGKVLGELEFRPDGSCSPLEGMIPQGARWEMAEQGLTIAHEGARWLFTAGPGGTYLGRCSSDDLTMNNRTAMLRLVKAKAEAAPER